MTHVRITVLMHSSKDMRNKEGKKEGHASTNLLPGEGGVQEERVGQGEGEGQGTWLHPWHGILPLSILYRFVQLSILCTFGILAFTLHASTSLKMGFTPR